MIKKLYLVVYISIGVDPYDQTHSSPEAGGQQYGESHADLPGHLLQDFLFMEEWRAIPGYEGFYEASELGAIRSVDRTINHSRGGDLKCFRKGRILSPTLNKRNGYLCVNLCLKGVTKTRRVNRLICLAFHLNPDNKPYVNHKDGDKTNNAKDNLEWSTAQENVLHAIEYGFSNPSAIKHPKIFTQADLFMVHKMIREGCTQNQIASYFSVCQPTISRLINGKRQYKSKYFQ